jgi:hypothetical protein
MGPPGALYRVPKRRPLVPGVCSAAPSQGQAGPEGGGVCVAAHAGKEGDGGGGQCGTRGRGGGGAGSFQGRENEFQDLECSC